MMTSLKKIVMLPVCMIVYTVVMIGFYPILLTTSILYAIYLRSVKGKVSDILQCGSGRMSIGSKIPYEDSMHYGCMIVIKKPILDKSKAEHILMEMAKSCEIPSGKVKVIIEEERPKNPIPPSGRMDIDHYVCKDSNFWQQSDQYQKNLVLYIRIWNGSNNQTSTSQASAIPTVIFFNGAAGTFDGSSNFNFVKEFLSRYFKNTKVDDFFQGNKTILHPKSKILLDQKSNFFNFLLRMPYNVYYNCHSLFWNLIVAMKWAGGPGISFECSPINYDLPDSELLAKGAKLAGVKPYAAMTYAAVRAYREVLSSDPVAIIQQSSLMSRHYASGNLKGRDYVGDWLIGPLQMIGSRPYGLKESEAGYTQLLDGLQNFNRETVNALEAKAWGLIQGGSGVFEVPPTYNDNAVVFDSIFFNNYGIRSLEGDFQSWNWMAPFKVGVNTICVNGITTVSVSSMVLGLSKLKQLRDRVDEIMRAEFINPAK